MMQLVCAAQKAGVIFVQQSNAPDKGVAIIAALMSDLSPLTWLVNNALR